MIKNKLQIENIPAILYGSHSDRLYIFIHGKNSNKTEAEEFAIVAEKCGYQVLSFDLPEHGERASRQYKCSIQNGVHDLTVVYNFIKNNYKSICLYACSLGAYFSLVAYKNIEFNNCLFVSPILDMDKLIQNMMMWADITEDELRQRGEVDTSFGETLSWEYYQYVKKHPIETWNNKTSILYGEKDNLTGRDVLDSFAEKYHCITDIMAGGEHYFNTPEQREYLGNWIKKVVK